MESQWSNAIFQETVAILLGGLFLFGIPVYFLRAKNFYFTTAWASLKSWLFAAPFLLACLGAPSPWPLITFTILAMSGLKAFFQITGIYHRTLFVVFSYIGIFSLALTVHYDIPKLYNTMPMILLGAICTIPILTNNFQNMLQYIGLTFIAFTFLGWSFMHLGWILHLENGIYQIMYLIILTEFCDNTTLATAKYFPKSKFLDKILKHRTLGGISLSIFLTLILAYGMRHLLPVRSEVFWLTAGVIASLAGSLGGIVMNVLRRDIGIKAVGPFILGRGDFLTRMERLIFTAPIYYYAMVYLLQEVPA